MFGSEILDVAIGLALVFLLLSLICSALREIVEAWFKTRAVYLETGIFELLRRDRSLVQAVYNHPMVAGLFKGDYVASKVTERKPHQSTNLPAYIPAANFAQALLDIAARGRPAPPPAVGAPLAGESALIAGSVRQVDVSGSLARVTVDNIRSTIQNIGQPDVQRVVLGALDRASGDINQAQMHIETWFNGAMDRVSGWYKRRTQAYLVLFGAVFAVAMNVDTIKIARFLYRNESARAALVEMAGTTVRDTSIQRAVGSAGAGPLTHRELLKELDELRLPLGWGENRPKGLILAIVGWLMTGVAVSLGAPFWFDLLNKFMVVRSTVKPHEKSLEEGSEDRQTRAEQRASSPIAAGGPGGGAPGGGVPGGGVPGGGAPGGGAPGGQAPSATAPPTDDELLAALPDTPAIRVQR